MTMALDFTDKSVSYYTFIHDLAAEVVRLLDERRTDPEMVSQNKAYAMFGRANVDRWRRQGRLTPYKRPGKIEYSTAELRRLQYTQHDFFIITAQNDDSLA